MPVNNLVILTSINLLNYLLHVPKYNTIAVTVQEKIHYVIKYEVIFFRTIWIRSDRLN